MAHGGATGELLLAGALEEDQPRQAFLLFQETSPDGARKVRRIRPYGCDTDCVPSAWRVQAVGTPVVGEAAAVLPKTGEGLREHVRGTTTGDKRVFARPAPARPGQAT
jgi:hypothetical protein